ncbi:hypothetical protein ACM9HF_01580 [Colwellia sp. RE-S-Sl-9]
MNKLISILGTLTFLSSTSALADTLTFSGATHCNEDVVKHATAFNNLKTAEGALNALSTISSESVGPTEQGYFIFDPQFERTTRYFNCSVPLTANMGNISLNVYGKVNGIQQAPGGCLISRIRKVNDGGIPKWFRFGTGEGFDWSTITNYNITGEQFVNYSTNNINNNYEADSTLELKCRTTWSGGSVSIGQIAVTY